MMAWWGQLRAGYHWLHSTARVRPMLQQTAHYQPTNLSPLLKA